MSLLQFLNFKIKLFVYFILLPTEDFFLNAELISKFIKYKLQTNFSVAQVFYYVLKQLRLNILSGKLIGFKIINRIIFSFKNIVGIKYGAVVTASY